MSIEAAVRIVIAEDLAAIIAFIVQYSVLAKWWRNPIGATIVVKDLLIVVVLAANAIEVFAPPSLALEWVVVLITGLIGPVMVWRMAVFASYHRSRPATDPAIAALQRENAELREEVARLRSLAD